MQLAINETKEVYEIDHSAEKMIRSASKWQEHIRIERVSPYWLWGTCDKFQLVHIYIHEAVSYFATGMLTTRSALPASYSTDIGSSLFRTIASIARRYLSNTAH
jgi:hypothetical protein